MRRVRLAALAVGLSVAVAAGLVAKAGAAVEQEVVTTIHFVDGCSGSGYWFMWDAVLDPDPTMAPGRPQAVRWGPAAPILIETLGTSILEQNRWAFLLLGEDGETTLFRSFFDAEFEPDRRYVLEVTLDCATTPYQIVGMPNSSTAVPRSPLPTAIGWLLITVAALLGGAKVLRHRER